MKNKVPFSEACDRNKQPILEVLQDYIEEQKSLLEIGHGTGQHAHYLSKNLKLNWYASDLLHNNWMLKKHDYIKEVLTIEIGKEHLSKQTNLIFDYVFTANTLHIMSQRNVDLFCQEIASVLFEKGLLFIYGPFKFNGKFTSHSNEKFDQFLKTKDPEMSIRDFEKIEKTLLNNSLVFQKKIDLPANNHLLVFKKITE